MLSQPNPLALQQPVVGHLVQELRQVLGLTQKKFAAQLGVTFPTLNRWENGHATPSPLALKQIETLLNQLSESSDPVLREHSQAI
ncbi:helix-turn-helix domain-containing protein [Pantanalinema sp. GBBB05]|uniref:helix-turn-helix domain-containing protein n=1 Tax=Pantanalinema sp. GBBB05 TaxID=2604139 RepID=UPI001D6155D9|nr:helix-turn-helix transcriptional regulator [Pantanalinema sp. GBBB05]